MSQALPVCQPNTGCRIADPDVFRGEVTDHYPAVGQMVWCQSWNRAPGGHLTLLVLLEVAAVFLLVASVFGVAMAPIPHTRRALSIISRLVPLAPPIFLAAGIGRLIFEALR
jgi:hypothetical protein